MPENYESDSIPGKCTCRPNNYDGDDGWDRDCPRHGVEADHE